MNKNPFERSHPPAEGQRSASAAVLHPSQSIAPRYRDPAVQQDEPVAIRSLRSLLALETILGDPILIHEVASSSFVTWQQLAGASPTERVRFLRPWAGRLRLPQYPPPVAYPGLDVEYATRYDNRYPQRLLALVDPPPVLRIRGTITAHPLLAVAGPRWSSPTALQWAGNAAEVAGSLGWGIVALLDDSAGQRALTRAAQLGVPAVAVAGGDPARVVRHELLVAEIQAAGGGLISEWGNARGGELFLYRSSRLVAALASAVLVTEAGRHPAGGADLIRATVALARPMATPAPARPLGETDVERAGSHFLIDPTSVGYFVDPGLRYAQERSAVRAGLADPMISPASLFAWLAARL